jgi:hypothetical protein
MGKKTNGGQISAPDEEHPMLTERSDSGQPCGGAGRGDVIGKVPDDVRIDPYVTEGHPGYDETGPSEIIPVERMVEGKAETK